MTSKCARKCAALARETMGGNGMLVKYGISKLMADIEGPYTFEGTYDINMLISGKELTGGM